MAKERVPPGQRVVTRFPRLDLGVVPRFERSVWRLRIRGSVERSLELGYKDIMALPRVAVTSDFHCVTGWTMLDNAWEGIQFRTIVELARPRPAAMFVKFECGDGYSTSVPISELMADNVLLAFSLDGKRLTAEHGGPLRLIIPDKYGYKSAKWVEDIEFTVAKELGYWEKRGYSDTGDPWTEDRYSR